jgi:hypothetical protein
MAPSATASTTTTTTTATPTTLTTTFSDTGDAADAGSPVEVFLGSADNASLASPEALQWDTSNENGTVREFASLGHRGPGYCKNGVSAYHRGADYHLHSEASALRHVDLNGCLSHCWETELCHCVTFKRDMLIAQGVEARWQAPGTCYMHHRCDEAKAETNIQDSEICLIIDWNPKRL